MLPAITMYKTHNTLSRKEVFPITKFDMFPRLDSASIQVMWRKLRLMVTCCLYSMMMTSGKACRWPPALSERGRSHFKHSKYLYHLCVMCCGIFSWVLMVLWIPQLGLINRYKGMSKLSYFLCSFLNLASWSRPPSFLLTWLQLCLHQKSICRCDSLYATCYMHTSETLEEW